MNFSAWSIRNPVAPLLAFFILVLVGWQAFNALPITRFPNIDIPLVSISVAQPGAAPSEMEAQVTKEIEDSVAGITGVKEVTSTISDGQSLTVVQFRMEVPSDKAVQDVKDAVDRIRGSLPGNVEAPIVSKIDIEGQAIMTFAVSAPNMSIEELSWFVDDVIKRQLQGNPGIGRIDRFGGADREVRIELDPVKLNSFGITAATVSQQLRATNANIGSGRSDVGAREQAIRTLGDAQTVAKLAATTIALPSGRFVKLENLGRVYDTYEELRSFSRFNGDQVVTFGVLRAKGASEVSVAEVTHAVLDRLAKEHPEVQIAPVDDTVTYTEGNYEAAIDTLLEGALLAVLVVFLFLRNWRATMLAAIALPLSAIPTFWVMDMLGFSLNLVSFLAITLATGILVDDAIVEIENISRHIKMGKTPYRAAIEAADEIGLAVIATSLTIVAVFVPVSFMPGIPGQYFRQFGLTVAIAVLFSLLVARLITPMMAAYLMRAKDAHVEKGGDGIVMRGYIGLVRMTTAGRLFPLPNPLWLLKPVFGRMRGLGALVRKPFFRFPGRYLTLLGAIGALVVSIYFLMQVPGSFIPPEDVSRIPISVELPPGSTLDETDAVTEKMRQAILNIDGIEDVFVLGGSSPTGQLDVRRASFTVLLDPLDHSLGYTLKKIGSQLPYIGPYLPAPTTTFRTRTQADIESEIFAAISGIPDIRAFKLNDRGERDISYSILSSNEADLNLAVARLEVALRGDPLLANVAAAGALPRPEIQVVPREGEAARLGISTMSIAETLRVATIGDVDAALAKISLDGRQVPVRVQLSDGIKTDLGRLGALMVPTGSGRSVPLSAVADIDVGTGPSTIDRLNRERRVTIGANLPPDVPLGTATARFQELVSGVKLPASVKVAASGDAEIQAEMQQSFGNAMVLGLLLVLSVLILLFRSVIQPFTILLSLPLAIGGVAAGLILTNNAMSMPVLIGILMLMGIVTKNAILLVDFGIEMRARGMNRYEAMVEAGHKRARPIVMTSIAMSAGMLPSALGVGEGGTFRAPMAIAVIGGIIVSTFLSLVVVPAFSLVMDDLGRVLGWVFGNIVGKKEAEPETLDPAQLSAGLDASRSEAEANRVEIERLKDRLHDIEARESWPVAAPRHVAE